MKVTLFLTLPLVAAGCGSAPPAPRAEVELVNRPPSAYAALVRALEVVDAIRHPAAHIRLRAVECDSLFDRQRGTEYVRVVLDTTVLAEDHGTARTVFQELTAALEEEARASARVAMVAQDRTDRVFRRMDWSALDAEPRSAFANLVSLSDAIRIEVRAGQPARLGPGAEPTVAGSKPLGAYVQDIAASPEIDVGELRTSLRVSHPIPSFRDLRCRLQPADDDASFTRSQIGEFLFRLEADSPGVTVTSLAIYPFEPRSDVVADRWRFEAELNW